MFKINQKQNKRFFVVDDFYEDPMAVREHALAQTYFPGEGAVGERTRDQFLFEGLKEKFEEIMQVKIADITEDGFGWYNTGINGRFQSCIGGVPQVFHCDAQTWAAVLFLTPHAPPQSGTSFYRNKKSKVNGTGMWHVMKNRYGADGLTFKSTIETSNGKIVIDSQPTDEDDEEVTPTKVGYSNFDTDDRDILKKKFFELSK
jgi:hypothetical protein